MLQNWKIKKSQGLLWKSLQSPFKYLIPLLFKDANTNNHTSAQNRLAYFWVGNEKWLFVFRTYIVRKYLNHTQPSKKLTPPMLWEGPQILSSSHDHLGHMLREHVARKTDGIKLADMLTLGSILLGISENVLHSGRAF